MDRKWMVVYPGGNKRILSIANVLYYEHDHWSMASFKEFDDEQDAAIYARHLSNKHGIALDPNSKLLHVLDLGDK